MTKLRQKLQISHSEVIRALCYWISVPCNCFILETDLFIRGLPVSKALYYYFSFNRYKTEIELIQSDNAALNLDFQT